MNTDTLSSLWIGAFRYYCGRETISVHAFCNDLISEYESIPDQAKGVIKRDLIRAFEDDDRDRAKNREVKTLGHDLDRAKWLKVLGVFSGLQQSLIADLKPELKQEERKMLTMTAAQIREALEFVNPDGTESEDGKEQQETELTFFCIDIDCVSADGDPLPRGIYCYLSEYPEEGCYGPLAAGGSMGRGGNEE